jgi:hypothetical protein
MSDEQHIAEKAKAKAKTEAEAKAEVEEYDCEFWETAYDD